MKPELRWIPGDDETDGYYIPLTLDPPQVMNRDSKPVNPFPARRMRIKPTGGKTNTLDPRYHRQREKLTFVGWVLRSPEVAILAWFILLIIAVIF